ncbi:hypothetical protein [Pseudomonas sp. BMS12]|uniref:hypothetical protein n=1 Tax=Pseudomonas sp. BMS12 TaxID=1796033 RepID=UPI00083B77CB|nr:hypothetical protein [Pseudomonas sp. BMS12]
MDIVEKDSICAIAGKWLLAATLSILPVHVPAADGDIIISREVQPRSATRPALAADPKPTSINPGALALRNAAGSRELSDGEFASISSGSALSLPLRSLQPHLDTSSSQLQRLPGSTAVHGGAGGRRMEGQIGRSIDQGLRPLQRLGGQ